MQYRIPTRKDVGTIRVEFDSSYEPSGPFGAKSIGEIVINTPGPAIANAVSMPADSGSASAHPAGADRNGSEGRIMKN